MAMLVAKQNVPFSFNDDFNKSVKDMFPDSNIAKQYSCGRTKATQIVKGAIAPALNKEVVQLCQNQPFGLLCDESTSRSTDKEFVILARVFNEERLVTKFLDMPVCNIGKAENLFTSLNKVLSERKIDWSNVVAFNSDNCSVMKGKHNSVVSRIKEVQPSLIDVGCICHLAQLATGCGIKALHQPIEEVLQSIYNHFDIRYCATRWLSLHTCINRVLNQWNALLAYFESHEDVEKPGKVKMLAGHLSNKETKFFFIFLSHALKPLVDFNVAFQAEGVMVHRLHKEMCNLVRRYLGRFLPAHLIADVPLKEIEFQDTSLQLPDEDLFIGQQAQTFLEDNKDELSVPRILLAVRGFFVAVTSKMLKVFPLDNTVLQNLYVLDPELRYTFTPSSVIELGKKLPQLELDQDSLREEVVAFQITARADLPEEQQVDRFWALIEKVGRFKNLARLMKALLCIPHSNASSERVFSMVRKIVTENRTRLDNSTLCSLLSCKLNFTGPVHTYVPTKSVLQAARHCTYNYNKHV
ncbi:hypothetical protein SKAU_G00410380 [Synaphobranchus kaupii]|uniref:HAT C-terminal dimerisation domain-containing protein n=1 Tax=Synaphobranchus kaupii TaxID=118154 RepID=A0A9Q1IBM7_SYNKA|nr:hypothetical protein SKAU_G00410380 [Synaphobranchus kaupii]